MTVTVYGGSFDPVHNGHLAVAQQVCDALSLTRLSFLPAYRPPHKSTLSSLAAHRIAMLELALADDSRLSIDQRELSSNQRSYTVSTMQRVRESLPDTTQVNFVMGWDSLQQLHTWWQWQRLFTLVNIIVVGRPGYAACVSHELESELRSRRAATNTLSQPCGQVLVLTDSGHDIASSTLRAALIAPQQHQSLLKNSLNPAVLAYIQAHGLYNFGSTINEL